MGLDTVSYSKVEVVPEDEEIVLTIKPSRSIPDLWDFLDSMDMEPLDGRSIIHFPRSLDGLDIVEDQFFRRMNPGPTTSIGYGGVQRYRSILVRSFWPEEEAAIYLEENRLFSNLVDKGRFDLPFMDLIWHSDCDGILGPVACRRLLEDFHLYPTLDLTPAVGDHPPAYYQKYHDSWYASVQHAADTGVIVFS